MRTRVGYGGPENYRHGQYRPGGRPKNGNMTEIERLIHLVASMQILFGSRRGGVIIPLLIIGIGIGGWYLYRQNYSPEVTLERAHKMWDSGDAKSQIKAISQYKTLLQKKSPIEPGRHWMMDDRDTLYRRIIYHEVKFTNNDLQAGEWIISAWDEGIRDLRFQDEKVKAFWEKTTDSSREKSKNRKRNRRGDSELDDEKSQSKPTLDSGDVITDEGKKDSDEEEKGKFDSIPGLDKRPHSPQATWNVEPTFSFA